MLGHTPGRLSQVTSCISRLARYRVHVRLPFHSFRSVRFPRSSFLAVESNLTPPPRSPQPSSPRKLATRRAACACARARPVFMHRGYREMHIRISPVCRCCKHVVLDPWGIRDTSEGKAEETIEQQLRAGKKGNTVTSRFHRSS